MPVRLTTLSACAALCLLTLAGPALASDFPDEKGTIPVAAWDVVPYQIISKPFNAGVVAFHEISVAVEFTVTAGGKEIKRQTVEAPKLNDRANVWEHFITVDPAQIPDGPFEITARCVPGGEGNRPVTLTADLFANAGGSLQFKTVYADAANGDDTAAGTRDAPLKTLKAAVKAAGDGGTVMLAAGEYSPDGIGGGMRREHWTTIRPAEGLKRDDVQIGRGRPGTNKLKFQNVCLFADAEGRKFTSILTGEGGRSVMWLDGCKVYNRKGRWNGKVSLQANSYRGYVTGGISTEMERGCSAILMRDHRIEKITSDAFTDTQVAINCSVYDIDVGSTKAHPDFHQAHMGRDRESFNPGRILYNCTGLKCGAQGLFGHNLKDSAFVNVLYVKDPAKGYLSQYSRKLDHVLFLHITMPNQPMLLRGNLKTRNCFMMNSIFLSVVKHHKERADTSGFRFANNLYLKANKAGPCENELTGDAQFVDPAGDDYHLRPTSPAAHSGIRLQTVPADCTGTPWSEKGPCRGALGVTRPVEAEEKSP